MYSLTYASSAVQLFSEDALIGLLKISRENNARLGVTGMLLYKGGNFLQVIEGNEGAVQSLHAKISLDPRHRGLITLLQGQIAERQFSDWAMGFQNLDTEEATLIPGYSDFLDTPLTTKGFPTDPSRAQRLLLLFKQKM